MPNGIDHSQNTSQNQKSTMAKRRSYNSTWHDSVTEQHEIWHVTTSHRAWVQCFCGLWLLRWKYVYKFGSYFDRGCYATARDTNGYTEHHDCDDGSYIWDLDFSNINPNDLGPILGELCDAGGWSCYGYMLVYYDSVDEYHTVTSDSGSQTYHVRSYDNVYDRTIYEEIYCHGSELVFTGC